MATEPEKNVPVPDPSRLTTEQLRRELSSLERVIDTRLTGMDRATALVALELSKLTAEFIGRIDRERESIDAQMAALREYALSRLENVKTVADERFNAVDTRFGERDARTQQAADESRISLDAALAAAKEAVSEQNKANSLAIGKSEQATKEKLDALALLMTTQNTALSDKLTALTTRQDRIEGRGEGKSALWAIMAGALIIIIALVGLYLNATTK